MENIRPFMSASIFQQNDPDTHRRFVRDATPDQGYQLFGHSISDDLKQISEMILKEAPNPLYEKFFAWLFKHASNVEIHSQRMEYLRHNKPPASDIFDILQTTEFPIPQSLQNFYAMIVYVDKIRQSTPSC